MAGGSRHSVFKPIRKIIKVCSMSGSKVYSIHGRGLKLDTKEDIEPYLKELQSLGHVEEIHIGGAAGNS